MKTLKKYRAPYLFILPFFTLFLLFRLAPTIWTAYISFAEWKGIGAPRFYRFKNYREMMINDTFWGVLDNMVVHWMTGLVMILMLAIVTTCLLNSQVLRDRVFFRTAIFLPNIHTAIAMGLISRMLFDKNVGLINELGGTVGFPKVPWLISTRYLKIPVIILNVWRNTPWFTIIVLSGLLSISRDYYEATIVDGISNLKQSYYITLPSLKSILSFCSVTLMVDNWKLFSKSYALPGPGTSNTSLFQYIYESGSNIFNMGYASAIGRVLIMILITISIIQFAAERKQDEL